MDTIYRELDRATILLVVGTSGSVYPAAGFVDIANQRGIRTVYVGPEEPLNTRRLRRNHPQHPPPRRLPQIADSLTTRSPLNLIYS